LHEDIFVLEVLVRGSDWVQSLPDMTFCPLELANLMVFPVSKFWNVTNHMNFLSRDGLVLHAEVQAELGILVAVRIDLVAVSLWRVRFLVVW